MNQVAKKFLSSCLLLFFILILLVLAVAIQFSSLAWLSNNKEVTGSGFVVAVDAISGANVQKYQIYKRSGSISSGAGAQIVYDSSDPDAPDTPFIEMTEYDTVFTDTNVNTPIIIRAVIEDVPSEISGLTVTVECTAGHHQNTAGKMLAYFSNIGGIRCGCIDTDTLALDADADTVYATAHTELKGQMSTAYTFATVNGSYQNTGKEETITIEIDDPIVVENKIYLFIEVDYDATLTKAYVEQHGIDPTAVHSGDHDLIPFAFDIEAFYVNYVR